MDLHLQLSRTQRRLGGNGAVPRLRSRFPMKSRSGVVASTDDAVPLFHHQDVEEVTGGAPCPCRTVCLIRGLAPFIRFWRLLSGDYFLSGTGEGVKAAFLATWQGRHPHPSSAPRKVPCGAPGRHRAGQLITSWFRLGVS